MLQKTCLLWSLTSYRSYWQQSLKPISNAQHIVITLSGGLAGLVQAELAGFDLLYDLRGDLAGATLLTMKSRALRRHHLARIKRKRAHYYGRDLRDNPKALGMVAITPQLCSCRGCGNQRKHEGPTLQERRCNQ